MRLCSALVLGFTAAMLAAAPAAMAGGPPVQERCAAVPQPGTGAQEVPGCDGMAAPARAETVLLPEADSGHRRALGEAPRMRVQGEAHMLAQDEVRFRAQDDTRFRFPGEARSGGDGGSGLRAQEAAVPRRIARADQQQPSCGDPRSADFPLGTRVHGGPASYQPGGAGAEWYVDLTNDTDAACHDIHPILLLVDRARNLQVAEVRTEFYDTASDSWRPVPLVRTDEDELIGVFGEGTPGFTVGAGRTVSVQVRLAFTEAARINSVVATTAVVQRKDADGEWVGRSGDYRFSIDPGAPTGGRKYPEVGSPYELARSGPKPLRGLGAAAVTLVVGGGALVLGARRAKAQTAGVRPARPTDVPH